MTPHLGAGIVPIYGQKLSPRWELLGRLLEIHRQGVVTWGFPACAGDEQGFQPNTDYPHLIASEEDRERSKTTQANRWKFLLCYNDSSGSYYYMPV